jgi:hypothetical protein
MDQTASTKRFKYYITAWTKRHQPSASSTTSLHGPHGSMYLPHAERHYITAWATLQHATQRKQQIQ